MFNTKPKLSKTLAKVTNFIEDLSKGVEVNAEEVRANAIEIETLVNKNIEIETETAQALRLMKLLSGDES